jgi:antitoxin HicB
MRIYNYTVIFGPLEEGGYCVLIPAISEICTFGETIDEARKSAEDAIRCYLESALRNNEPIPVDRDLSIEKIAVEIDI